jgi:hypothetical protein
MTPPAVHLAADDPDVIRAVRAAFEEEGVPLLVTAPSTARAAAIASPLQIGIAAGEAIEIALATGPDVPYLVGDDARAMGHAAARLAARRPLGTEL